MSQADEELGVHGSADVAPYTEDGEAEWADLRPIVSWVRGHPVLVGALIMIAAQVAWKAQFLGHLYFRQDDFHDLDLAVDHSFNWNYLSYIGSGHLIIGLRLVAWPLVRISSTPYNWAAASDISLAFVAAAGLAAYRLLRDLFGDRPAILIPLAVYMLTPLTLPDLGIWSSALESVPLQLATFMALSAHLRYVGNGRTRHLAVAAFWVAFGMIFFEKGLVLPGLLFGITAAFLTGARTLLAGCLRSLVDYWKAWAVYAALVVMYVVILLVALRTSATQPAVPRSGRGVAIFTGELLRDTFLPAAVGGPWKWFPVSGHSFSFAAPPSSLVVLSAVVAVAVVAASIWLRPVAWRAWLILAGWIAVADMLPVVIGRVNTFPNVLGLETRYVADAAPVLIICLGLAFLPLATSGPSPQPDEDRLRLVEPQILRSAVAAMVALFVFGSIWSVQSYENVTNGNVAASYISNAALALRQAPRGTPVVRRPLPPNIVEGTFGAYAYTSKVIGYMERGKLAGTLRWIVRPRGTVDGLMIFGPDGRLRQARVNGAVSRPAASGKCFPRHHGQIDVRFRTLPPRFSGTLRIGYLWFGRAPGTVFVRYGTSLQALAVQPGLHSGYLPIRGTATDLLVEGAAGLCVGDVEAGNLGPARFGPVIPPVPARP